MVDGEYYVGELSARPLSVDSDFTWLAISVLSGEISMKRATNNHHVSGNFWKCYNVRF